MLDLYMSDVLFRWFNDSKAIRNSCIFGKKMKIKTKTGFNANSTLLNVLESYLYILLEF